MKTVLGPRPQEVLAAVVKYSALAVLAVEQAAAAGFTGAPCAPPRTQPGSLRDPAEN